MNTIKALCPRCGQVDVAPHDIALYTDDTGDGFYAFECPGCGRSNAMPWLQNRSDIGTSTNTTRSSSTNSAVTRAPTRRSGRLNMVVAHTACDLLILEL